MQPKKAILILAVFFAHLSLIRAQDVAFSQFYANPVYLNPALTGSKLCNRITLNYRNQWSNLSKGYVTYSTTWDNYYNKISGGLGVIANASIGGGGIYNEFTGSAVYSYRLQASHDLVFNAAMEAGYIQRSINWDKYLFGDQIDIYTGNHEQTKEVRPGKTGVGAVDISTGLLAGYKESVYVGLVINHLSRPDMSFYDGNPDKLNMRITAHAGAIFDFVQGMEGEDLRNFSLSPNVVYFQQGKYHQLNLGMSINVFPLTAGLWFRNNFENPDAFIILFGIQQKQYKIGYSFDYTVSRLSPSAGCAHEVSIAYLFNNLHKKVTYHAFRGPTF